MDTEDKGYLVTRDGVAVAEFELAAEAWAYLLRIQGQSVHWAVTYEGWDIISQRGGSLATEYAASVVDAEESLKTAGFTPGGQMNAPRKEARDAINRAQRAAGH